MGYCLSEKRGRLSENQLGKMEIGEEICVVGRYIAN